MEKTVLEIVERREGPGARCVVPNEVRLNGRTLMVPEGAIEVDLASGAAVRVTMTILVDELHVRAEEG